MLISVIIPTYRPKEYLYECLDSLYCQTLDGNLWEIVLVLNGCGEPYLTDVRNYLRLKPFKHIRLLQLDTPGVSHARNVALEEANGEYITFIDDDDYVSPTYLESLAAIAKPDTIAASYAIAFSDANAHITPYYIEQEYLRCSDKGVQPFYEPKKYMSGPWMKLIHRSVIGDTRFDESFRNGEDALFMFAISNKMRQIAFTDKSAVYYRRMRSGSASHTISFAQLIKNRIMILRAYTRIYCQGQNYSFYFYFTRILGAIHALINYRQWSKNG